MIWQGLTMCLTATNLAVAFFSTFVGIIIGAMPGLGASIAMTLALPFTAYLRPDTAIITLVSLYCGATFGGSISAILINTPGTPASGATVFDGFPMTQRGEADKALGLALGSSFVGGEIGAVMLITIAPIITNFILSFGPSQSFLLAIFSMCIIGALGKNQILKGLLACCLGLMISFIGADTMLGTWRFSYGSLYHLDRINVTVSMIGCFAISEMIRLIRKGDATISQVANAGSIFNAFSSALSVFKRPIVTLRSSLIGSVIGAMPALGVTAASFLSYMTTVNLSSHPEKFGKGEPDGVIAPEAANNAVTATALIPTLTLGIPGSGSMAIVLGALTIQGLVPGPDLFANKGEYVYSVMWAFFFINIMMLIIGLLCSSTISKVALIPNNILVPCVIVFCYAGAFALRGYWQDIVLVTVMGFVGYILKANGYPIVGLILGLVLGPIAEQSFHQALRISEGNYAIFYSGLINQVLIALILGAIAWPTLKNRISQSQRK